MSYMDSEEEKEFEKKLEENFEKGIQLLSNTDSMAQWCLINKILFYIFFTMLIFVLGLFSIAKKIILFRFSQIPIELKTMTKMDGILRKYLMF